MVGNSNSGSKKGKAASNYKKGQWLTAENKRKAAKRAGKDIGKNGTEVVHHKKPVKRDKQGNIVAGKSSKSAFKSSNLTVVSRSKNKTEGKSSVKKGKR